jgi:hypothetical protein
VERLRSLIPHGAWVGKNEFGLLGRQPRPGRDETALDVDCGIGYTRYFANESHLRAVDQPRRGECSPPRELEGNADGPLEAALELSSHLEVDREFRPESVAVRMVGIRHMRMRVPHRVMTMSVAMAPVGIGSCACWWRPSSWRCACSCYCRCKLCFNAVRHACKLSMKS